MSATADTLRVLHQDRPLILPNVWDAASARAFAAAGFPALATSSAAVVAVLGYEDHEDAPVDEVLAAIARITRSVDIPVTADFESGYGLEPADVVDRLLGAGAAGCNLEDTDHALGALRPVAVQAEWLGTVVDHAAGRLVVNARVDTYVRGGGPDEDAVERASAYLGAGADCAYPIGRLDEATTAHLVEAIPGPVNILSRPEGPSLPRLGELGVARITFGSGLHHEAMATVIARAEALPRVSTRSTIKRHPERGSRETEVVHAVLDAAPLGHLGFVVDGQPFVIPMLYGRIGDALYLHGSMASRLMRTVAGGVDVCLTATLVDGLVLARSAFHHSMNYRSAVVFGRAVPVDGDEKCAALKAISEHLRPGRWDEVRPPSDLELRQTAVLRLDVEEMSAKARTGGPIDEPQDLDLPVWAGVIPCALAWGTPEPA